MGYLIKKVVPQIVTAKILLGEDDIAASGSIYQIPEYPAIPGYFWNVLYMNGEIVEDSGTTPFTGTTNIHIQAEIAPNAQFRFGSGFMANAVGTWHTTVVTTILPTIYSKNSKLEIHNNSTLTGGATGLNIYVGAILIEY